eukprot:CAMPEP_0198725784 /NCGR_PEP_ID=MMETSP1475-20131203/3025_1 /TAXON_ID= ORGANISM="Unidentified sp., Strain CCMP1999" /NCGR_SAMPLE_ID=MMETSP1475 /ASSEMBLY_ACC=CAM_ASM_001111 /LENGTH=259 /DNA_ID=CAMNT_0044487617 /DNA_START=137 /DNA_END=916 /DNA_ORIENTATION=+
MAAFVGGVVGGGSAGDRDEEGVHEAGGDGDGDEDGAGAARAGEAADTAAGKGGARPGQAVSDAMVAVGEGQMDIYSRLAKDRILVLGRAVDDEVANSLVAQMLYLSSEDSSKDITIYINSPGGSVSAGMAIFDAMQYIKCDIQTICYGVAASMGAFLLGAGTKGKRKALPNARIMIHQPLGGAQGQAADIEIQAREILFVKNMLNTYMSSYTGKSVEQIVRDTDRDFFMTPVEAKEYGIIDEVIQTRAKVPNIPKPELV